MCEKCLSIKYIKSSNLCGPLLFLVQLQRDICGSCLKRFYFIILFLELLQKLNSLYVETKDFIYKVKVTQELWGLSIKSSQTNKRIKRLKVTLFRKGLEMQNK